MNSKCCFNKCNNEIEFIENTFGAIYCEECERLLMLAKLEKIDILHVRKKRFSRTIKRQN